MPAQAAKPVPSFVMRRRLVAEDLRRLDDPCVLFEHEGRDSDGQLFFIYTVAGVLDGWRLPDGCTIGGEVIIISGVPDRATADVLASCGLEDTINALDDEERAYQASHAALARLAAAGRDGRMDAALKPDSDKSEAFMRDQTLIRPLVGDDIVMTTGSRPTDSSTH